MTGTERLEFEHLVAIRSAGPGNWSADGRHIAFVWAERSGTSYLWTYDVEAGQLRRVSERPVILEATDGTDRRDTGGGPQWSPTEPKLAFLSNSSREAGTSVWSVGLDGNEAVEITQHVSSDRTPRWSPDGRRIAFVGNRDGRDDIQIVPAEGGIAVQYTYDRWDNTDLDWSPDGQSIVYISQRSDRDLFSNNICIVNTATGEVTQITTGDDVNDRSPRWSPDGSTIAFVSNRADTDDIWLVAPDGSELRRLTAGPGEKADPQWSPEGTEIAYTVARHCATDIYVISANGGEPRRVTAGGINRAPRWSPPGGRLLYLHSGAGEPANLWIKPAEGDAEIPGTRITDVAQGMLDGIAFVVPDLVTYSSEGGFTIEALLYRPVESQTERGPAIVWVHGGGNALLVNDWIPLLQFLVQRGYTILAPNYRGSTGYGKAFMEANMGEQTGDDLHDWVAAAAFLRELPEIDPESIAIMGASWGGYATLISLGRAPGVFQAGVALAAPSHWFSYWEETRTSWTRRFRIKLMGPPALNVERYRRQSAQEYAANFAAPVLILHGQDDPGVPVGQATGMARALARHDKPHELMTYPGEGHSFRKPEAMIDSARRIEAFLNEHL